MANVKISELPANVTVSGQDVIVINQDSVTRQAEVSALFGSGLTTINTNTIISTYVTSTTIVAASGSIGNLHVTNLTVTGTLSIPAGSITTVEILDGTILLQDLSTEVLNLIGGAGGGAPYSVFGLRATNTDDVTTVTATSVVLALDGTGAAVIVNDPASKNIDQSTAGPVANGRDQAGAFTNDTWLHLYYIYRSDTGAINGIISATAPPTGPTFPTNYTHWAYIGANYLDSSGNLREVIQVGDTVYHTGGAISALSAGTQTGTAAVVDMSTGFPPNAIDADLQLQLELSSTGATDNQWSLRVSFGGGTDYLRITQTIGGAESNIFNSMTAVIPNIEQECEYLMSLDGGAGGQGMGYILTQSFRLEN